MKKVFFILTISFVFTLRCGFSQPAAKITWHSFEDAVVLSQQLHKKVFIDVYTDWCGWCKVYDKSTFPDSTIVRLMNKYFIAVKLNAERKDTVIFNNYAFVNPNPEVSRSPHQLASSLLKGKMSYPTVCFLDDSMRFITSVASYLKPVDLEPILEYIGGDKYLTMTYDSFRLSYKPISGTVAAIASSIPTSLFRNLHFESGKSEVSKSTHAQLDSIAGAMKKSASMKIEIGGYTDNTGTETSDGKLSENRAKAIYDYLVAKGVESTRMSYAGYGQLKPAGDNTTESGKLLNRRVEFKVISE